MMHVGGASNAAAFTNQGSTAADGVLVAPASDGRDKPAANGPLAHFRRTRLGRVGAGGSVVTGGEAAMRADAEMRGEMETPRGEERADSGAGRGGERRPRYRYCPLEAGEPIDVSACATCPHNPPLPFRICFAPKPTRPRRRGFWDREEPPQ